MGTPSWSDHERLLFDLAGGELGSGCGVAPTWIAFRGEQALFVATLRPFDKGHYDSPIVEVGALAAALDADRCAFSISGRAWSLEDPIPPVLPDGGDLRQQVVIIHVVDGFADPLQAYQVLRPFQLDDGTVTWGEAQRLDGGSGWIPDALKALVRTRKAIWTDDPQGVAKQLVRCERLGHRFAWGDTTLGEIDDGVRRYLSSATAPAAMRGS